MAADIDPQPGEKLLGRPGRRGGAHWGEDHFHRGSTWGRVKDADARTAVKPADRRLRTSLTAAAAAAAAIW